jgi:hypothetical protein
MPAKPCTRPQAAWGQVTRWYLHLVLCEENLTPRNTSSISSLEVIITRLGRRLLSICIAAELHMTATCRFCTALDSR